MSETTTVVDPQNQFDTAFNKGNEPVEDSVEEKSITVMMVAGISLFVSLICVISAIFIYQQFFLQKQKIGVVDLKSVLETAELVFTEQLSRPNVTDDDRKKAYEIVKDTGEKIQLAIEDIQASCDCVLMTKAAVIGGSANDYTLQVKQVLGLDTVDTKALQARVVDAMTGKLPGSNDSLAPAVAPTAPAPDKAR